MLSLDNPPLFLMCVRVERQLSPVYVCVLVAAFVQASREWCPLPAVLRL
jgi:hypothetical protein